MSTVTITQEQLEALVELRKYEEEEIVLDNNSLDILRVQIGTRWGGYRVCAISPNGTVGKVAE